ncbi:MULTISPECIES: replication protein [Cronobacter]|uniref:replication protein n=1 Tax=Cronobacter TaxID=413496 RepID=UPI0003FAB7DA|nr:MULTISPECIES: replication protein [Cronobacter]PUX35985.1 DNA replication protein [Cronobacter sakazakii]PUX55628.1 DNA replication protein [Cronobacter sakazakii]PUX58639.1 DNA replication protein [Cronobacter sakazakii]PUX61578.1 DNA replication protein [Cronobacter sakazakii]
MSNLATVTQLRPVERPAERRVAEIEDGYTRLANALYDELIGADLTKNQSKVAHAICRKTYGFGKKMDRISDSQLAQLTRLPRQKVNKAKNELIAMKVIRRDGQLIGPNKEISEWQIEGCHYSGDNVTAMVTNSVTKTVTALSPKQGHTKETITKEKKETTQTHEVGLSDVVSEKPLTPRQLGTNPRATGTNPRSKLPVFDRERLKETWNCKAERFGLPKIRSVTTTVENGIKRLWVSYLKQCKELKREPKDIDSLLNGYLEHGYQPTPWAMGQNPEGKRYGIETALRQEKIDQILGADS